MAAAMEAGAVAPACPADSSSIGIPPRTQASMVRQDSSAKVMGGTTKQLEFDTKGRSRHLSSPPAIMWSISSSVRHMVRAR